MDDSAVSITQGRALAAARCAEAMLRTLGGTEVKLRFPTVPQVREANLGSPDSADPRLGLAETGSEDVVISPVVLRRPSSIANAATAEMLFAASSIAKQLDLRGFDTGEELLSAAVAVVHHDRTYRVTSISTDFYGGAPYLYRVTVTE